MDSDGQRGDPLSVYPILIAEGYATAASIHLATSLPTIAAFDAGNLEPVGLALREKYPHAPMLILADNDHSLERNVGLEKAERAANAVSGQVIVPDFTAEEKARGLTDFNDLHEARSLEEMKRQVAWAIEALLQEKIR